MFTEIPLTVPDDRTPARVFTVNPNLRFSRLYQTVLHEWFHRVAQGRVPVAAHRLITRTGDDQPTEHLIILEDPIEARFTNGKVERIIAGLLIVHPTNVDGWWFTGVEEAHQSWNDLGEIDVEEES